MGGMNIGQVQRDGFEERLMRIQKGGANTMGEIQIGPRDDNERSSKPSNTVRVKRKKAKNVNLGEGSNAVLVPTALIIGALSMFVGKAAAYHLFSEGGLATMEIPVPAVEPYLPYAPFVFAGFLALMFSWTFGFSNIMRKLAVVAGLAGVFWFEGDLIERFPGIYTNFYSEAYVAEAPPARFPAAIEPTA